MAKIDVPYLVAKKGAKGRILWYWDPGPDLRRAGWKTRRLAKAHHDDPTVAVRQAQDINDQVAAWRAGATATATEDSQPGDPGGRRAPAMMPATPYARSGTLDALIGEYKLSRFWRDLRPSTQRRYRQELKILSDWAGAERIEDITAGDVQTLYEALYEKTPRKAKGAVAMASVVFEFARRSDKIAINPAARAGVRYKPKAPVIWPREAVAHFVAAADARGRHSIGTAVTLNEWFGQRKADLLALSRKVYRDGGFHFQQSKTGARVVLPVDLVPHLVERLEAEYARQPAIGLADRAILIDEATGQPYNAHTFDHVFAEIRAAAAETMKDVAVPFDPDKREPFTALWFSRLRHTAVVRLAEAGCSTLQIATVTGHSPATVDMIMKHYWLPSRGQAAAAFKKRLEHEGK